MKTTLALAALVAALALPGLAAAFPPEPHVPLRACTDDYMLCYEVDPHAGCASVSGVKDKTVCVPGAWTSDECVRVQGQCSALVTCVTVDLPTTPSTCGSVCLGDYEQLEGGCRVQTRPLVWFASCGGGEYALWVNNGQTMCMFGLP